MADISGVRIVFCFSFLRAKAGSLQQLFLFIKKLKRRLKIIGTVSKIISGARSWLVYMCSGALWKHHLANEA